jgi:hypothetical protein
MDADALRNIQITLFNALPKRARVPISALRYWIKSIGWRYKKDGLAHLEHVVGPLFNHYEGCRCVLLGNGPSLRKMDLGLLQDEYTFGLNRIYLLFDELGFETTFLASINRLMLNHYSHEMSKVASLSFFNWAYRGDIQANDRTVFISPRPIQKMDGDIIKGYCPGTGTVTNVALEILFYLGFTQIILIGLDFSFIEKGSPGEVVIAGDSDRNHFTSDYYAPGDAWQLPNYEAQKIGYQMAKNLYESDGRTIVDATVGGKLNVFDKVEFRKVLSDGRFLNMKENAPLPLHCSQTSAN